MDIELSTKLQHPSSLQWRRYNKGVVIEPGLALNETAAEFFLALDGHLSVGDVCERLAPLYVVPQHELKEDILELARSMVEQELLVIAELSE